MPRGWAEDVPSRSSFDRTSHTKDFDVNPAPQTDSADFIDQARWLLEWHNRRSEAFTTRAVAVLVLQP